MDFKDVIVFILTGAGALVLFGLTVFMHELGHFLMAKRLGLVIDKFAIGMGPKIFGFKRNGVEYVVNWLPLGGFVALPQMAPMEMVEGKGEHKREDLPEIEPYKRILTAFWGPLFSFLFAVVLALGVWKVGYPQEKDLATTVIGGFAKESPARDAGLELGDKILKINGEVVEDWEGVVHGIIFTKKDTISVEVEKVSGLRETYYVLSKSNEDREGLPSIGIMNAESSVLVESVSTGGPAQKAGFQKGDQILNINDEKVYSTSQIIDLVQKSKGNELLIGIQRGNEAKQLSVMPVRPYWKPEEQYVAYDKYMVGIKFDGRTDINQVILKPTPVEQIERSLTLIYRTVSAIFNKDTKVGVQHMSGPVGILRVTQRLLEFDWRSVLYFGVVLNVNLALLNLMPIPILDGGHIVFSAWEWLFRRPVHTKIIEISHTAFFVLLAGFFLFITYRDLSREAKQYGKGQEAEERAEKMKTLTFEAVENKE